MRVPLSWIKEFADIPASISAEEISDALVRVGFEVEEIDRLGADLKGRDGIYNIDVQTRQVTPIVVSIPLSERPSYEGFFWSGDQKRLYYQRQNGTIVEHDLASGQDRIIAPMSSPADGRCGPISMSPDRRSIATCRSNLAANKQALVVIPIDGGERRELLLSTPPQIFTNKIAWLPDGTGLVVGRGSSSPNGPPAMNELWLVSAQGAAKLGQIAAELAHGEGLQAHAQSALLRKG